MTRSASSAWLTRVQHDLVKRLLWTARDYRAAGQPPPAGSLITHCINDEGAAISAVECWQTLKAEAPEGIDLADFEHALEQALAAANVDDVEGVLRLQAAFERLRTPHA